MKRILSVLLALALLCCAAACAEETDYLGIWYMVKVEVDGAVMENAALGVLAYLDLKEDGSVEMLTRVGDEEPEIEIGSWVLSGGMLEVTDSKGVTVVFSLVDGLLYSALEESRSAMTFSRENPFEPAGE